MSIHDFVEIKLFFSYLAIYTANNAETGESYCDGRVSYFCTKHNSSDIYQIAT